MRKVTFLIVDDSPMWRKVIKRFIEEKLGGNIVGEAKDGIEAIVLYKKLKPDIVTMDIEMPNLDGIKALEEILNFDKDAKVIMISSKGEEDVVRKALLKGAQDFIRKDLKLEKWVKRFEKVIREIKGKKENMTYNVFSVIISYINKLKNNNKS
ncbi:response regulator receiver protein [Caldicellulosiruptor saccharolyticus DSM 8903]|uniref:Response regulator receiver protein n=1 Tax=Caldicellulosiruptor saccharolyticus (strain ATCC 43494 / DSM 8903 / Tp8T 6331) TaxID=351627 RepID=A4XHQ3_CALS8|nr:response regulator [Caldicellulosiruptor saccharolyticus]ABP66438.1 response regulator receiver protein [Caldicellulosiruptor saccharolyticus DSM 8903]